MPLNDVPSSTGAVVSDVTEAAVKKRICCTNCEKTRCRYILYITQAIGTQSFKQIVW